MPLFGARARLRLTESRTFEKGVVVATFIPAR